MNPVATSPWLVFAVAALPLCACAGSLTYSAEAIEARVVDAETRQPLEGAVVTANWQLEEGTFGGNVQAGQLMVMEAVTDRNGAFRFPAWGPKKATKGHLVNDDPQLLLFKPGYEYRRLSNDYSGDRELRLRSVRRSKWNGRVIVMTPLRGMEVKVHLSNLLNFSKDVEGFSTWYVDRCQWTNLPTVVGRLRQERQRLEIQGINTSRNRTLDQRLLDDEQSWIDACGLEAKNFFAEIRR